MSRDATPPFAKARPVWPIGRAREMNRFVRFRATSPTRGGRLRVTASTMYRVHLNNQFVGSGPARAAHGYFHVDEWRLNEAGELCIEVVGYNVNSYYTLDQPAFLLAELVDARGNVMAATGESTFAACLLDDHVQRVERYSVARTFSEVFRLRPSVESNPVQCETLPSVRLLPRRVPYPDFAIAHPLRRLASGTIERFEPQSLARDWTLTCIGPDLKGFTEDELEIIPSLEVQKLRCVPDDGNAPLGAGRFETFDFGSNLTGFIRIKFRCASGSRLAVVFDEILTNDGDVSFNRLRCNNVIWIEAEAGRHEVETFEPYTMQYLKVMCLDGASTLDSLEVRRFEHPSVSSTPLESDDDELNRIYDAGVSTFRQNAVDLPTDCPSRERAAWLCDSFYTCRAAFALTGSTALERNFLENYLLADRFDHIPGGMIPMNYPSDHPNGKFIPNWALWFVLQLEAYLARSGDRAMIDALRPRVEGIFRYFERFQNADGLLERLEGWVFVEWSRANDFAQDVNYPTNMLYAAALDAAARLYDRADWSKAASQVRGAIRAQSFDGEFFVDNAVREGASLKRTANRTEVCQYHAFHFGLATPDSHPALWRRLVEDFGPKRAVTRAFHGVYPANALMGYTLRLELLERYGLRDQLLEEIRAYFLPMARQTGTLWEHNEPSASCCHGFASHVCCWLRRALRPPLPPGEG
jgi:alpha-L-rhamnosidase